MRVGQRIPIILGLSIALCLALAVLTVRQLDQLRPSATLEEVLYVPSPKILKRMSLGYGGLLADIYWTRAVQYFGRHHFLRAREYNLLAPLLQITTALDPHLMVAYEFGGMFLAQRPPEGAGMPDKAVQLLEQGITQNPGEWKLYYDLGFINTTERKDYGAAAKAFERGSAVPGAHPWLKVLAAHMAEHGGDLQTARFMWTKTYETTQDKSIRANAAAHLRALQVDQEVLQLEAMARKYRDLTGFYPESLAQLARTGWLPGIPLDPIGHPYRLVPGGRVEVAVPDNLPFITEGLPPGMTAPAPKKLSEE